MDDVIICYGLDSDQPIILESDKVTFSALNYIIILSPSVNWTLSDFVTHVEGWCFLGESTLKSLSWGLTITVILFSRQTLVFFQAEMWRRVGRTGRRTDTSPRITVVFFSSYMLPKTVTVTTFLTLFGPVMLLLFSSLLFSSLLFILLSEGSMQLWNCQTDRFYIDTGSVC